MLPVLLDIGFITIYTQGVFMVLAFFWSAFLLWRLIQLTSYDEEVIFDTVFFGIFGGLLISRVFFVALHFEEFGFDILKFILINGYPGLHLIGGLVGFFLFVYIYSLWKNINFSKLIDYIVPPLLLAIAIGKLGSFFSGSEIGTQTNFIISLTFPGFDEARHLTPLYESVLFFISTYWSYRVLFNIRRDKYYSGFNFVLFLFIFSFIYTVFDPIKSFRTPIYGISFDLIVSGIFLLTTVLYFIYYFRTTILTKLSFKKK